VVDAAVTDTAAAGIAGLGIAEDEVGIAVGAVFVGAALPSGSAVGQLGSWPGNDMVRWH
jgi:hypothetical protein